MTTEDLTERRRLAVAAGREWLVEITDSDLLLIAGTPVTAADVEALEGQVLDYLLANENDPPELVERVRGIAAIHVRHHAVRHP
ncbi:hypothetical protein [Nonomuraea sp. NPDC049141]|uniref:hypothetical protein n=1 Tax=Nonomuraea sp. NPDC049141 TaxID=3155500 RepID=UPI0033CFD8FC